MFGCPIITQEPRDIFASNFDWVSWETHANVLSLVLGSELIGKIFKVNTRSLQPSASVVIWYIFGGFNNLI